MENTSIVIEHEFDDTLLAQIEMLREIRVELLRDQLSKLEEIW